MPEAGAAQLVLPEIEVALSDFEQTVDALVERGAEPAMDTLLATTQPVPNEPVTWR